MTVWFLILLGLITYLMVQRSVARLTRTPVWLLWLVLMTPAMLWTGWTVMYGDKQPLPQALIIWPLVICPILYWVLFQSGRQPQTDKPTEAQTPQTESPTTPTEPNSVRPIQPNEEQILRDCFPWSVYYIQNIEYRPQAVICRGQLRSKPNEAYQKIKENIETKFAGRFLVFFQEGVNAKPFFVLIPNTQLTQGNTPTKEEKLKQFAWAFLLFLATLLTTTKVGVGIAGVELTIRQFQSNPSLIFQGLPYALALMLILGIHELGHYLMATKRYRIRSTPPYFIPMPFFLGTFGAFIKMRSPVPNRKALFDVSIAGPLAGFIVTLPLLFWGLAHSTIVSLPDEKTGVLNPDALNPKYSILLALLSKLALGSQLTPQSAIDLHPVAVAACLGLIVTALNLMPVGQLDGGHIVHAMFGQRNAIVIGQIARLLLLLLSLVQPGFFLWALILLFIPLMDEPALNDVTDLDNQRDVWGLFAMALLVMIILPLPQAIASWLQI
ncbi:site-2 protease family protein [Mastigocladus laminosus UU774]|nr:site-2 protease family protein [Westiellopsis prolifica IICB1]TFI53883.1 site-2 protease family protein [Mastigocladus laminosus UU774]